MKTARFNKDDIVELKYADNTETFIITNVNYTKYDDHGIEIILDITYDIEAEFGTFKYTTVSENNLKTTRQTKIRNFLNN